MQRKMRRIIAIALSLVLVIGNYTFSGFVFAGGSGGSISGTMLTDIGDQIQGQKLADELGNSLFENKDIDPDIYGRMKLTYETALGNNHTYLPGEDIVFQISYSIRSTETDDYKGKMYIMAVVPDGIKVFEEYLTEFDAKYGTFNGQEVILFSLDAQGGGRTGSLYWKGEYPVEVTPYLEVEDLRVFAAVEYTPAIDPDDPDASTEPIIILGSAKTSFEVAPERDYNIIKESDETKIREEYIDDPTELALFGKDAEPDNYIAIDYTIDIVRVLDLGADGAIQINEATIVDTPAKAPGGGLPLAIIADNYTDIANTDGKTITYVLNGPKHFTDIAEIDDTYYTNPLKPYNLKEKIKYTVYYLASDFYKKDNGKPIAGELVNNVAASVTFLGYESDPINKSGEKELKIEPPSIDEKWFFGKYISGGQNQGKQAETVPYTDGILKYDLFVRNDGAKYIDLITIKDSDLAAVSNRDEGITPKTLEYNSVKVLPKNAGDTTKYKEVIIYPLVSDGSGGTKRDDAKKEIFSFTEVQDTDAVVNFDPEHIGFEIEVVRLNAGGAGLLFTVTTTAENDYVYSDGTKVFEGNTLAQGTLNPNRIKNVTNMAFANTAYGKTQNITDKVSQATYTFGYTVIYSATLEKSNTNFTDKILTGSDNDDFVTVGDLNSGAGATTYFYVKFQNKTGRTIEKGALTITDNILVVVNGDNDALSNYTIIADEIFIGRVKQSGSNNYFTITPSSNGFKLENIVDIEKDWLVSIRIKVTGLKAANAAALTNLDIKNTVEAKYKIPELDDLQTLYDSATKKITSTYSAGALKVITSQAYTPPSAAPTELPATQIIKAGKESSIDYLSADLKTGLLLHDHTITYKMILENKSDDNITGIKFTELLNTADFGFDAAKAIKGEYVITDARFVALNANGTLNESVTESAASGISSDGKGLVMVANAAGPFYTLAPGGKIAVVVSVKLKSPVMSQSHEYSDLPTFFKNQGKFEFNYLGEAKNVLTDTVETKLIKPEAILTATKSNNIGTANKDIYTLKDAKYTIQATMKTTIGLPEVTISDNGMQIYEKLTGNNKNDITTFKIPGTQEFYKVSDVAWIKSVEITKAFYDKFSANATIYYRTTESKVNDEALAGYWNGSVPFSSLTLSNGTPDPYVFKTAAGEKVTRVKVVITDFPSTNNVSNTYSFMINVEFDNQKLVDIANLIAAKGTGAGTLTTENTASISWKYPLGGGTGSGSYNVTGSVITLGVIEPEPSIAKQMTKQSNQSTDIHKIDFSKLKAQGTIADYELTFRNDISTTAKNGAEIAYIADRGAIFSTQNSLTGIPGTPAPTLPKYNTVLNPSGSEKEFVFKQTDSTGATGYALYEGKVTLYYSSDLFIGDNYESYITAAKNLGKAIELKADTVNREWKIPDDKKATIIGEVKSFVIELSRDVTPDPFKPNVPANFTAVTTFSVNYAPDGTLTPSTDKIYIYNFATAAAKFIKDSKLKALSDKTDYFEITTLKDVKAVKDILTEPVKVSNSDDTPFKEILPIEAGKFENNKVLLSEIYSADGADVAYKLTAENKSSFTGVLEMQDQPGTINNTVFTADTLRKWDLQELYVEKYSGDPDQVPSVTSTGYTGSITNPTVVKIGGISYYYFNLSALSDVINNFIVSYANVLPDKGFAVYAVYNVSGKTPGAQPTNADLTTNVSNGQKVTLTVNSVKIKESPWQIAYYTTANDNLYTADTIKKAVSHNALKLSQLLLNGEAKDYTITHTISNIGHDTNSQVDMKGYIFTDFGITIKNYINGETYEGTKALPYAYMKSVSAEAHDIYKDKAKDIQIKFDVKITTCDLYTGEITYAYLVWSTVTGFNYTAPSNKAILSFEVIPTDGILPKEFVTNGNAKTNITVKTLVKGAQKTDFYGYSPVTGFPVGTGGTEAPLFDIINNGERKVYEPIGTEFDVKKVETVTNVNQSNQPSMNLKKESDPGALSFEDMLINNGKTINYSIKGVYNDGTAPLDTFTLTDSGPKFYNQNSDLIDWDYEITDLKISILEKNSAGTEKYLTLDELKAFNNDAVAEDKFVFSVIEVDPVNGDNIIADEIDITAIAGTFKTASGVNIGKNFRIDFKNMPVGLYLDLSYKVVLNAPKDYEDVSQLSLITNEITGKFVMSGKSFNTNDYKCDIKVNGENPDFVILKKVEGRPFFEAAPFAVIPAGNTVTWELWFVNPAKSGSENKILIDPVITDKVNPIFQDIGDISGNYKVEIGKVSYNSAKPDEMVLDSLNAESKLTWDFEASPAANLATWEFDGYLLPGEAIKITFKNKVESGKVNPGVYQNVVLANVLNKLNTDGSKFVDSEEAKIEVTVDAAMLIILSSHGNLNDPDLYKIKNEYATSTPGNKDDSNFKISLGNYNKTAQNGIKIAFSMPSENDMAINLISSARDSKWYPELIGLSDIIKTEADKATSVIPKDSYKIYVSERDDPNTAAQTGYLEKHLLAFDPTDDWTLLEDIINDKTALSKIKTIFIEFDSDFELAYNEMLEFKINVEVPDVNSSAWDDFVYEKPFVAWGCVAYITAMTNRLTSQPSLAGINVVMSKIGDQVWLDENGDGEQNDYNIKDDKSSGLKLIDKASNDNLKVVLFEAIGYDESTGNYTKLEYLESTTLDKDGRYEFNGLLPGHYVVGFEKPDGYYFTEFGKGNAGNDSNVDPSKVPYEYETDKFVYLTAVITIKDDAKCHVDVTWDAGLLYSKVNVEKIVLHDGDVVDDYSDTFTIKFTPDDSSKPVEVELNSKDKNKDVELTYNKTYTVSEVDPGAKYTKQTITVKINGEKQDSATFTFMPGMKVEITVINESFTPTQKDGKVTVEKILKNAQGDTIEFGNKSFDIIFTPEDDKNETVTVTLKEGKENATVDLAFGETYTVTEKGEGAGFGYTVGVNVEIGTASSSNRTFTFDKDMVVKVTVTNTEKTETDYPDPKDSTISIEKVVKHNGTTLQSYTGEFIIRLTDEDGLYSDYRLNSDKPKTDEFKLTYGKTYTVTELYASAYIKTITVNGSVVTDNKFTFDKETNISIVVTNETFSDNPTPPPRRRTPSTTATPTASETPAPTPTPDVDLPPTEVPRGVPTPTPMPTPEIDLPEPSVPVGFITPGPSDPIKPVSPGKPNPKTGESLMASFNIIAILGVAVCFFLEVRDQYNRRKSH